MHTHADDMLQREEELELRAALIAEDRITEAVKRNGLTGTTGGKSLINRALGDLTTALEDWLATQVGKKRKPPAYKFLSILPATEISYIAIRMMVNDISDKSSKYDTRVRAVSAALKRAIGAALYSAQDKEGFDTLVRLLDWQPRSYIRKRMEEEVFTEHCIEVNMTDQDVLAVGTVLVELFVEVTELFKIQSYKTSAEHTQKVLTPTSKAAVWLREAQEMNIIAMPFTLPMVIEPFPWTTLTDGGYLLQSISPVGMVRKVSESGVALEAADLSRVMTAINAIQETPWRINSRVHSVWKDLLGTGMAGCSSSERLEIPESIDIDKPGSDARKNERRECFEKISDNNSKLLSEVQKSRIADIFIDEERFYFPHNIDFRGRIYPMTGVGALNPQGDDSGKGLLEFAEGKALGEDGLQWLYIHTQNVWGNDKCSLQDRIDATEDNLYQYRQYAADPLNCTGWMEADKPFCFLACCFELLDLGENPEEHVSHLPIALDGSCSGLQHFAAMMLDEKLAEAVNVIQNSDRPNDIYTMVAERAAASVAEDDSEEASYWNGKVTRDIVKQPVMTLAYGVSRSGMRNQVSEKCKKLVRKGHSEYKKGSTSVKDADGKVVVSFAGYMADQIHDSISGVSKSAFHVMDWLGAAATAKAAACDDAIDGALSWTSPIGLPVLQEYYDYDSKRVNTYFEGRRIRFTQRLGAAAVDARKQKQGAAPNFVHSMDAAHLMLTVNECIGSGIGINSFAMIHDSFGTHASDTGALFEILREQFHLMYREDALMHLYADLPPAAKLICGEPPSRGSLDLSRVQDSEYFFN